jgi:L-lysine 2,3-aminomutase
MDSVTIFTSAVRPKVGVRAKGAEPSWRRALAGAIRDPAELCELLELPADFAKPQAAGGFPLLVPREFVARMKPGDPRDPLLLQVLPTPAELATTPGFSADPVGDGAAEVLPGLLHKYAGRVLLITTGACAVHCRYCFRRHFPYEAAPKGLAAWEPAIDHIAADESIHEVILSGGDPLTLVDETLAALAERLAEIPHLKRLRAHTRLPIVLPQRVTEELLAWLTGTRLAPWMVVHANHANEIDGAVAAALGRLIDAGVPVLNQAVLLAGVNDTVEAQAALNERLVNLRVQPYYLHQLDRVAGAAHFAVPTERGAEIVTALRGQFPGYAVPLYVEEIAHEVSKQLIVR